MIKEATLFSHRHQGAQNLSCGLDFLCEGRDTVVRKTDRRKGAARYMIVLMVLFGTLVCTHDHARADFNGDGFADAVVGSGFGFNNNRVCLGNGCGDFTCSNVDDNSFQGFTPAVGDMNNDGLPDVVFASVLPGFDRICLNAGNVGENGEWEGFECQETSLLQSTLDVALGFVDEDQNLDAVFAGPRAESSTLLNIVALGDGVGGYKEFIFLPGLVVDTRGVAVGDVDHNGLLDAVFANATFEDDLSGRNQV